MTTQVTRQRVLMAALLGGAIAATAAFMGTAQAEGELNLYSSRHYDTDERLYSDFEEATGITINRIEDSANVLIERIRSEGANSPADVLLTVDACGPLIRRDSSSPFPPARSKKASPTICAIPMAIGSASRSAPVSSSTTRTK